jgi:hypothetical protein
MSRGRASEQSVCVYEAVSDDVNLLWPGSGCQLQWGTGSGPVRMCGDIFAAERLWRGSLLMTGHLSSSHPVVMGAGDVAWGSLRRGGGRCGRAPGVAMPSACGFSAV